MIIEKLTDSTRALLLSTELGAPVVALIDQLTAALEAAERRVLLQADAPELVRSHEALQAEVTRLTAALEAAESQRDEARGEYARLQTSIDLMPPSALAAELKAEKQRFAAMVLEFGGLKDAAESLQARVAELEAVREATLAPEGHGGYLDLVKRANAAESELADLRGRVKRAEDELQATDKRPSFRIRRAWEILRGR